MKIDKEERRIIDKCYNRARAMLTEHKETLDRIARALQERESLQKRRLDTLIAGQPLLPDIPALAPSTPSLVSRRSGRDWLFYRSGLVEFFGLERVEERAARYRSKGDLGPLVTRRVNAPGRRGARGTHGTCQQD